MVKKAGITISSRKAKGRRLQQWVAQKISEITGIKYGKDEMIASREMGQNGVDIRLVEKAKILFPFSVECKNTEKLNVWKAIDQARDNQMENTDWLVVAKRNREKPIVIIDAERFFSLLSRCK